MGRRGVYQPGGHVGAETAGANYATHLPAMREMSGMAWASHRAGWLSLQTPGHHSRLSSMQSSGPEGKLLVPGKFIAKHPTTPGEWDALRDLFGRPWFERVWTSQEICAATSSIDNIW
jgi:hypothetical protein